MRELAGGRLRSWTGQIRRLRAHSRSKSTDLRLLSCMQLRKAGSYPYFTSYIVCTQTDVRLVEGVHRLSKMQVRPAATDSQTTMVVGASHPTLRLFLADTCSERYPGVRLIFNDPESTPIVQACSNGAGWKRPPAARFSKGCAVLPIITFDA